MRISDWSSDVCSYDLARHRSYPVVDGEGGLLGLVSRSDALGWRVSDMPADGTLADLVSDAAQPVAYTETPVGQVADMIVESGVGQIGRASGRERVGQSV